MVDPGAAGPPGLELLLGAHQPGEVARGSVLRGLLPRHQGLQVRNESGLWICIHFLLNRIQLYF